MWETVGVAVFALRRTPEHRTELLRPRRAARDARPAGCTAAGPIAPGEREVDAAVRELWEATALTPERLYAAAFSAARDEAAGAPGGRIGLFVAFVDSDARPCPADEDDDFAWEPLRSAVEGMAPGMRGALERVLRDFVRRAPDEALRVH